MTLILIIPNIDDRTKILCLLDLLITYEPCILLCSDFMKGRISKMLKLIQYTTKLLIKDYKFKIEKYHKLLFYIPFDDIKIITELLLKYEKCFKQNQVDILSSNIKFFLCQSKVLPYNKKFWDNMYTIFKQKYKRNRITYDYIWSNNIKSSIKKEENVVTKKELETLFNLSPSPFLDI